MDISRLKVISGGQTGADFAGLLAAKWYKIPTGGYAPKEFWTSQGSKPMLGTVFHLEETAEPGYSLRTLKNILAAHVTLISGSNLGSAGTALTLRKIRALQVPYKIFRFDPGQSIDEEIAKNMGSMQELADLIMRKSLMYDHVVLNIAGNSTPSSARSFDFTFSYVVKLFELLFHPGEEAWVNQPLLDAHRDNYENLN